MTDLNAITIAQSLIRCPSITPLDEGAISTLNEILSSIGFRCTEFVFEDDASVPIRNLYATFNSGHDGPNFCFAGHTDVVPPGNESTWQNDAFSAVIKKNQLWGRGAVDMKGAIAAFVAAANLAIKNNSIKGTLSLLITGDEEGEAINGTRKLLKAITENHQTITHCLVGEPTNPLQLGEMIKVGRRGSINCWLTVEGQQGHVAYPDRARNPIPSLLRKLLMLSETPLDEGYDRFQPSSLQVTDINIGNSAHNVIPAAASARFNIRFNPNWTGESLQHWLKARLDEVICEDGTKYTLKCIISGEAFLTKDDEYLALLANTVENITGKKPELSTSGGTSDARFIKDYAPVAEFGLVGATMHKVDERVAIDDIKVLQNIYQEIIKSYFLKYGAQI